jgi:hypothetical protein
VIAPRQPIWYSLVAVVVSMILLTVLGAWYTNRTAAESERKWCELLGVMDEAYSSSPPRTEIGRQLARAMNKLRSDFGCA